MSADELQKPPCVVVMLAALVLPLSIAAGLTMTMTVPSLGGQPPTILLALSSYRNHGGSEELMFAEAARLAGRSR
jgi:hypothetical protein